jgi:hypothetical protein
MMSRYNITLTIGIPLHNESYTHTYASTYPELWNPLHMNPPWLTHTFVLNTTGNTY